MNLLCWLRPWRRPAPTLNDSHVVLYTRRGCHLCEDARALLQDAQERYGFVFEVVNVDTSPELVARYGEWVPVVTVDDKLRFKGGVSGVLLLRLLRAEVSRRKRGVAERGT